MSDMYDERKPECLRCSKFGRQCEGYPTLEKMRKQNPPATIIRKLLAKPMSQQQNSRAENYPSTSYSFQHSDSIKTHGYVAADLFEDHRIWTSRLQGLETPVPIWSLVENYNKPEDEDQFIEHFRNVTAEELSGGFSPRLWKETIMEASERCGSIRLLVISAGALSIARMRNEQNEERSRFDPLHPFGLQKYGEALIGLRELVDESQECIEVALVSALLIFCIENLAGDFSRAIMQFQTVTPSLIERVTNNPKSHYFLRVKALGTRSIGVIDGSLLNAFMRFDKFVLGERLATDGRGSYSIFAALFATEKLTIPPSFEDIDEARVYLDDMSYRMCATWNSDETICSYGLAAPGSAEFTALPRAIIEWWHSEVPAPFQNSGLKERLARWHERFMPILDDAMRPSGAQSFVAAATLHIEVLIIRVLLNGCYLATELENAETERVGSTQLVDTMLSFAEKLISCPEYHKGFVFDTGIIPYLFLSLVLWPEKLVKARILEIMRGMIPRRDGVLDSTTLVLIYEQFLQEQDLANSLMDLDFL